MPMILVPSFIFLTKHVLLLSNIISVNPAPYALCILVLVYYVVHCIPHYFMFFCWIVHMVSLLESRIFLCVQKPTEKCEYRQKNIFLTVYPQKNTHRNIMTEKSNFSVDSPSEIIFLWVLHAQKNYVRPD